MSFADEIRAAASEMKCAPQQEIDASARKYVDYVKQCLIQKARDGEGVVISIKTGLFSSKAALRVSCSIVPQRVDYITAPVPVYYSDSDQWFCTLSEETMKKWNQAVLDLLKQENIHAPDQYKMGVRYLEYEDGFQSLVGFEMFYPTDYTTTVDL